jgi:hypothetical protein
MMIASYILKSDYVYIEGYLGYSLMVDRGQPKCYGFNGGVGSGPTKLKYMSK